ncbi:hypothetical protein BKA69DRAFT_1066886 [Paraphysoderma sedebokerense]|nr:hypothetical protein BKA69DRAFT_1066886 [Paraphysoderma sedebokerense]
MYSSFRRPLQSFAVRSYSQKPILRSPPPHFAIVGAGPAGFYTAYRLMKLIENVKIDMYEALPVPYGLVRFGVAPDHPEVKNVIHKFEEIATTPNFKFFGNVEVGKSVPLSTLSPHYNGIILSYGAPLDKSLNIPGESLKNVFSAREFVGWYNAFPDFKHLNPDLDTEVVSIFGMGNVALDCARVLLKDVDTLAKTDISDEAIEKLKKSRVKRVRLIGRRGPIHVAFTAKEIRELLSLKSLYVDANIGLINGSIKNNEAFLKSNRPKSRILSLIQKHLSSQSPLTDQNREFKIDFFRSPVEILGSGKAEQVKLRVNTADGDRVIATDEYETIESGMVLKSIGYKSTPMEGLPFDHAQSIVPNEAGRVTITTGGPDTPLYVSGWLKRGPTGVIATTMSDAFETADTVVADLTSQVDAGFKAKAGGDAVVQYLMKNGVRIVDWSDWKKIDRREEELGRKKGKPRDKIDNVEDMLAVIDKM